MNSSGDVNRLPFAASAVEVSVQTKGGQLATQEGRPPHLPKVSMQTEDGQLPMGVPLLFIDASAPQVQTGLWLGGRWLAYRSVQAAALEEIFRSVQSLLTEAKLPFSALGGFIHNEGPGSILGIRLGAMALRVWAQATGGESPLPIWAVRSLPLVAAKVALWQQAGATTGALTDAVTDTAANKAMDATTPAVAQAGCVAETVGAGAAPADGQVAVDSKQAQALAETFSKFFNTDAGGVFSEFRQGLWNWFTPSTEDVFGEGIEVIATEELARRLAACRNRVWHLRHRKSWEAPPGQALEADSDLCDCPQVFLLRGLLRRITVPEALLTRAPEFKTASGERHRGSGQAGAVSLATGRQLEGKRPSG